MTSRALLIAFAVGASAIDSAQACTTITYDMTGVSADAFAADMVDDAATIQLMRIESRSEASMDVIRAYAGDFYGQIYLYRLTPVSTLKGFDLGPMSLHGFDPSWPWSQMGREPPPLHPSLFWLTEQGYAALQETVIPDPQDPGSTLTCAGSLRLVVGETYLVFRQPSGDLLAPGFTELAMVGERHLPVIERVDAQNDPWLREVRDAIAARPASADFWKGVFELLFGRSSTEVHR